MGINCNSNKLYFSRFTSVFKRDLLTSLALSHRVISTVPINPELYINLQHREQKKITLKNNFCT